MLMDFLDEPAGSVRRQRAGAYVSYGFGQGAHRVLLVLLDVRFFRRAVVFAVRFWARKGFNWRFLGVGVE
jgi:hypothetical protein